MRPIASRPMVVQRAMRKTPLMSAPRISARCQPYELAAELGEVASLMVYNATISDRTSLQSALLAQWRSTYFSMWNESATRASEPTA